MQGLAILAYLVLGIIQLAAIMAGLTDWLDLHWIIAGPIALFTAYIPLLGSLLGVAGAMTAWDWALIPAVALFFAPFIAIVIFAALSGLLDSLKGK